MAKIKDTNKHLRRIDDRIKLIARSVSVSSAIEGVKINEEELRSHLSKINQAKKGKAS